VAKSKDSKKKIEASKKQKTSFKTEKLFASKMMLSDSFLKIYFKIL
jgi:hypothetical protein